MSEPATDEFSNPDVSEHLRRISPKVPAPVRYRFLSALEHFDRAARLLNTDREMASFRAITGEEEAATALIKAIQLRSYPHSDEFNSRDHKHKAAVIACVMAIGNDLTPLLREFQITFDFEKGRVDVKVPLSNFNVVGGDRLALQPVEPLDLIRTREGQGENQPFRDSLEKLAALSSFENIKRLVAEQANSRNKLLYASDSAMPLSKANSATIQNRKRRAMMLLVLSIMVLQSRKRQGLVGQAILAFLSIISRLPSEA